METKRCITGESQRRRAFSLAEIAEQLGVSLGFMRLEASRGRLITRKIGRRRIALAEDLDAYLNAGRDGHAA